MKRSFIDILKETCSSFNYTFVKGEELKGKTLKEAIPNFSPTPAILLFIFGFGAFFVAIEPYDFQVLAATMLSLSGLKTGVVLIGMAWAFNFIFYFILAAFQIKLAPLIKQSITCTLSAIAIGLVFFVFQFNFMDEGIEAETVDMVVETITAKNYAPYSVEEKSFVRVKDYVYEGTLDVLYDNTTISVFYMVTVEPYGTRSYFLDIEYEIL